MQNTSANSRMLQTPVRVTIKGNLDIARLADALSAMVERHEALRTVFREQGDQLWQEALSASPLALEYIDLTGVAPANKELRLQQQLAAAEALPIDLSIEPGIRAQLIGLESGSWVLSILLHHIISDGASVTVFQNELWVIYEALSEGHTSTLAPLQITFSDFAVTQIDWVSSPAAQPKIDYWLRVLSAPLPILDFPLDRPHRAGATSSPAMLTWQIPKELIEAARQIARTHNTTIFSVTAAAFAAVLSRLTAAHDLIIGVPVANRREETEAVIGRFSSTAALRLTLTGNPTLESLVDTVRDTFTEALDASDIPLEYLLQTIDSKGRGGRSPLFQFYFQYHAAFLVGRQVAGLRIDPLPAPRLPTPHELQLDLIERADGVTAIARFDRELLDESTVQQILELYENALQAIVTSPKRKLCSLPTGAFSQARGAASKPGPLATPEKSAAPTGTERQIIAIWENILAVKNINTGDDFFDLGGRSLHAARFIQQVHKVFGLRLDISKVAVHRTVAAMAAHIGTRDNSSSSNKFDIVIPLKPSGHLAPIFFIHGVGGHVLHFRNLAAHLPAEQPMFSLSAPELCWLPSKPTIEDFAALYIQEIRKIWPNGPIHLCGYSAGGTIAHAMATQLADAHQPLGKLIILDHQNFSYYRNLAVAARLQILSRRLVDRTQRYLQQLANKDFAAIRHNVHFLTSLAVANCKWRIAEFASGTLSRPGRASKNDNMAMFHTLIRKYQPRSYPGNVLLIRTPARFQEPAPNPTLGWNKVVTGEIDVKFVTGSHETLLDEPHVHSLITLLSSYLSNGPVKARDIT